MCPPLVGTTSINTHFQMKSRSVFRGTTVTKHSCTFTRSHPNASPESVSPKSAQNDVLTTSIVVSVVSLEISHGHSNHCMIKQYKRQNCTFFSYMYKLPFRETKQKASQHALLCMKSLCVEGDTRMDQWLHVSVSPPRLGSLSHCTI